MTTTGGISRAGEKLFEKEILTHYDHIKIPSFSDDRIIQIFQQLGVDYCVLSPFLSVELKTRSRTYDDILLETHQSTGPGWAYTCRANLLVNLWLDTKSCAVVDLRSLQGWWSVQRQSDFKEVTATNHRGEVSRSRIIPFEKLVGVNFKRATLPLDDPGGFLILK